MSDDSKDDLSRLVDEFYEKQRVKQAEQDRVAAERIDRLRDVGMTDDQIRAACAVMQEVLDEHTATVQKEWDRQMSRVVAKLKSWRTA